MKQTASSIPICGAVRTTNTWNEPVRSARAGQVWRQARHAPWLPGAPRRPIPSPQPEQFRRCPHGICGAGTVPNIGQMIAVTPNNTNGRSENWRGSASPVPLSSVYLSWGPDSSVVVTSFLICLRRAFAIGPWRTAVLVDELNAGGLMRIPNLIRYAGSKPRASATSRGDQ
jgi:hypothetical protein